MTPRGTGQTPVNQDVRAHIPVLLSDLASTDARHRVMGRSEKRLGDMRNNPRGDWQISDIRVVCDAFGIALDEPTGGGSHYKISHERVRDILTVPTRRPIKPVYIRSFVAFVDEVKDKLDER